MTCPEKREDFSKLSLSGNTVAGRVDEIAEDLRQQFKVTAEDFVAFSIAADESTDISNTAQLAIFIRGISSEFEITEQLLDIVPLHNTTTAADIFDGIKSVFDKFNLPWSNLTAIATDGAPAMAGKKSGLAARVKQQLMKTSNDNSYVGPIHCIIHQENLCCKHLAMGK